MPRNINDTDQMRATAQQFFNAANDFLTEHDSIQSSLAAISQALGEFQTRFNSHNENVNTCNTNLNGAAGELMSCWESGAADTFEDTFGAFSSAMENLSTTLEEISRQGQALNGQIEGVVTTIKQHVSDFAEVCDTTHKNFTEYADIMDENDRRLAQSFGG